jgi:hypothetical protein
MSKILRRPMFRGGGKVSSYGNGISTGLADGGEVQPLLVGQHPEFAKGPDGREKHANPLLLAGTGLYNAARLAGPATMRYGRQGLNSLKNLFTNKGFARGTNRVPNASGSYSPVNPTSTSTLTDFAMPSMPGFVKSGLNYVKQNPKKTGLGLGAFALSDFTDALPSGRNIARILPNKLERMIFDDMEEEKIVTDGGEELTEEQKIFKAEQRRLQKLLEEQRLGIGNVSEEDKFAKLKKDKEMFKKILSDGKSTKIQDASEMALSFAGNALEEGATTKSALAKFFKDEAKRPSKGSKINDAASAAVLNAYIAGEKTKGEVDAYFAKLKVQTQMGKRAGDIPFHLNEAGKTTKGYATMDRAIRNAFPGKIPNKVKTGEDFKITNDMIGEIFIEDEAPYSVFTITEDLIKETLY